MEGRRAWGPAASHTWRRLRPGPFQGGQRPHLPPGARVRRRSATMARLLVGRVAGVPAGCPMLLTWRRAGAQVGTGTSGTGPGSVCGLSPFGHQPGLPRGLPGAAGKPGCRGCLGRMGLGGGSGPLPDHTWVTLGPVPEEACPAPSPVRPSGPAGIPVPPGEAVPSPVRVSRLGCRWVRGSAPGAPRPHPLTTPSSPAAP